MADKGSGTTTGGATGREPEDNYDYKREYYIYFGTKQVTVKGQARTIKMFGRPTNRVVEALDLTPASEDEVRQVVSDTDADGVKREYVKVTQGSRGAKSFKVPLENRTTEHGYQMYVSIPVPSQMSIWDFMKWAAKEPKIKSFITPDGRSYPVFASASGGV